jgi:hypothetical protein
MYKVYNNPGIEQNHLGGYGKLGFPTKLKIFYGSYYRTNST